MSFFSKIFGWEKSTVSFSDIVPWDISREAIYEFLIRHLDQETFQLADDAHHLPDEEVCYKDSAYRFAPGMIDGVMALHRERNYKPQFVQALFDAFKMLIAVPNKEHFEKLYVLLNHDDTLENINPFIDLVFANQNCIDLTKLYEILIIVVCKTPDRTPLKFCMVILGIYKEEKLISLYLLLAHHEELTQFALYPLLYTAESRWENLFMSLASRVHGWGKISIILRLVRSENNDIKAWLIREGYKNSIMHEYTAYMCAIAGGLKGELERAEIDDALFDGTCDILDALLVSDSPCQTIDDYEDGAAVISLFVNHSKIQATTLQHFLILKKIKAFVEDIELDSERESIGWTLQLQKEILKTVGDIIARPFWKEVTEKELHSFDDMKFYSAATVANDFNIDVWDNYYHRQKGGMGPYWSQLFQTDDKERIRKVIDMVESQVPFDKLLFKSDNGLDSLQYLQDEKAILAALDRLDSYPGKGLRILKFGISSITLSTRRKSLEVLNAWGPEQWSSDVYNLLQQSLKIESDETLKKIIEDYIKDIEL